MSRDARFQSCLRLAADGSWEVEIHDAIVDRLPTPLRDRVALVDDAFHIYCESWEVPAITEAIVKVAGWWEPRIMTRYRLRAERTLDADALRAALTDADVRLSMLCTSVEADGGVAIAFSTEEPIERLRALIDAVPGGRAMRETMAPLKDSTDDWLRGSSS